MQGPGVHQIRVVLSGKGWLGWVCVCNVGSGVTGCHVHWAGQWAW